MDEPKGYILRTEDLRTAVEKLFALGDELIAPTATKQGDVFFEAVQSVDEIDFGFGNALVSPVQYLMPAKEVLFEYQLRPVQPPEITPPELPPERILFGIRPCDIAAIECLDQFFIEREPVDVLYQQRRERVTLIALACAEPAADTCFCSCCEGSGPVAESGYDVQLSPVGEVYLVEFATDRGERIRQQWQDLLEPAPEELFAAREAQLRYAIENLFEPDSNLAAAIRRVTGDNVSPEAWREIGADCYSCGACSYLCPVCTCYDVMDVPYDESRGARIRRVDSCRLGGFTREATGHVARPTEASRARWYTYHKLSHDYHEQRNNYGCVGCGRCIIACLGQIGMPTVCRLIRQPEYERTEQ